MAAEGLSGLISEHKQAAGPRPVTRQVAAQHRGDITADTQHRRVAPGPGAGRMVNEYEQLRELAGQSRHGNSYGSQCLGGGHAGGADGGQQPGEGADDQGGRDAACPSLGGDDDRHRP